MHELQVVKDFESGKISKEELDMRSTCDYEAEINDGLTDKSRIDAHIYRTEEAL